MSTLSRPAGVPGITAVPPTGGARFGPLPCTNILKSLFGDRVRPFAAASANPSATGNVPPPFVVTPPDALPEQTSNAPEQSAKLITIDGVGPIAAGDGNNPWPS